MIEIIDKTVDIEDTPVIGADGKIIGYTWRVKKETGHLENFDDGTGKPVVFWKN